jgi:hypothetical protein
VVTNNRPANSDDHLIDGAADTSSCGSPWNCACNDSFVACVPVWNHCGTNGFMAIWLIRRTTCSPLALPPLTISTSSSIFVRLNSPDSNRRKQSLCFRVHAESCALRQHSEGKGNSGTQLRPYDSAGPFPVCGHFHRCFLISAIQMATEETQGQEQLRLLSKLVLSG